MFQDEKKKVRTAITSVRGSAGGSAHHHPRKNISREALIRSPTLQSADRYRQCDCSIADCPIYERGTDLGRRAREKFRWLPPLGANNPFGSLASTPLEPRGNERKKNVAQTMRKHSRERASHKVRCLRLLTTVGPCERRAPVGSNFAQARHPCSLSRRALFRSHPRFAANSPQSMHRVCLLNALLVTIFSFSPQTIITWSVIK